MPVTILLVDDHPLFRKGLRLLIEEEPDMSAVGEAGDGKEAIEKVRELSPDVVIMDISMKVRLPITLSLPLPVLQPPRPPGPPTSQPLVEPLTNRELDVLGLLTRRLSNKEIADKLFISTTTVKGHLQNTYQKLEFGKRREAVEKAQTLRILSRR
jgi:DNA-binding NarL/FixJ family response regulator